MGAQRADTWLKKTKQKLDVRGWEHWKQKEGTVYSELVVLYLSGGLAENPLLHWLILAEAG